jgi:PleD family two-component response regulator
MRQGDSGTEESQLDLDPGAVSQSKVEEASRSGPQSGILLVDDNPDSVNLLSLILARAGYRVWPALDGSEALEKAELLSPDLILLDIMMPGLDGYQVCERLKAQENTRDIPVIFISAIGQVQGKVRALAAGGVDYITKPFQTQEVLARVATHLSLRALQRELELRNAELQQRNAELQQMLETINTLSGLIPICAWCSRKIEDESGEWVSIEAYIESHSEATLTHSMCPDCLERMKNEAEQTLQSRAGRRPGGA